MKDPRSKSCLLGIGLDDDDGHKRVTKGENLLLVGGSQETHERMQDHAIYMNEALAERGKDLSECSREELIDVFREAADRCS